MFGYRSRSRSRSASRQPSPVRRRQSLTVELLEDRMTPAVTFLGVGAGDATASDAILWTRAQDSTTAAGVGVIAQVSADQSFATGLAAFAGVTDPAHDYTLHLDATGLQSGTRYFYRFVADDTTVSQVGTFTTAPAPTANVALHAGFTGDADGQMRPYDATGTFTGGGLPGFAQQNFNYFVWLGDTIYETASGAGTPNNSPAVPNAFQANNDESSVLQAYWAKYRQQLQPVSTGSYPGLNSFFSSTGHYTLLDNHELGNKQFINGGAPQGSPAGSGADATNPANDVNTTGTFLNQTPGFNALVQAYTDYQPIRVQTVNAPNDPRSNGTQQLYYEQQWGASSAIFNLDDRSYRDIRMKTASGADDTGPRGDNAGRTMLGATELQWFETNLLAAQNQGVTWKIVAVSSPIDEIGPIGGSFTISNAATGATGSALYTTAESDGGKSWMGEYRAERNQLLKFIADNHIDHVVFLTTDDHQVRVNEVGYFTDTTDPSGSPAYQASYTRIPGVFQIVVGPIGATGPDGVTDHSTANLQALAQSFASQQIAAGIDPLGLDPNFPGLQNVSREGDPNANTNRSAFDFYSPDTFNYATLDLDPSGQHLTVTVNGLNSYAVNTFPQPSASNPVRQIMQFTIGLEPVNLAVTPTIAAPGGVILSATLTDANTNAPLVGKQVSFSIGSQVLGTATTDSTGKAALSSASLAALAAGNYTVSVTFQGDAVDLRGTATLPLSVVTTDQQFIQRRYLDALGRFGSPAELSNWVPLAQTPGGKAAVAIAIDSSLEALDRNVKGWYFTDLGRQARNGEEMGWVSQLQQGQTEEQVLGQILASTEFFTRAQSVITTGSAQARYVGALYKLLLGRTATDAEVASWVNAQPPLSQQAIAVGILQSAEDRTLVIRGYYTALLHRTADVAGLNAWVQSQLDLFAVRAGIEKSAEFATNG